MKRLLFTLFVLTSSIGFNQTLDSLYVSNGTNTNTIDVTVIAGYGSSFSYIEHTYSILNDTVYLDVCYSLGLMAVITQLTNTFEINLPSEMSNCYLGVNIHNWNSPSCTESETVDSAYLEFDYPLTNDISLENSANPQLSIDVYPNPVQNQLAINTHGKLIKSVQLFSMLGQKVMEHNAPESDIDVSAIENGIYFLVVKTSDGILKQKIVVRR